jgi:hypothetical protein
VVARLEAAGVPAAPIWNIEQALNSEQIRSRGLLCEVEDERLPGLQLPTQPVHFNGALPNRAQRAPALGEHTGCCCKAGWAAARTPLPPCAKQALWVDFDSRKQGETAMSLIRLGATEEDQAVADAVARFAEETLAPVAQAMDEEAFSATRHVPGLSALGVMGMNLPERFGGPGVTPPPC